jgi:hypothetical protein
MTVEELALQQEEFINTIIGEFSSEFDTVFEKAKASMTVYVANGGDALAADAYWIKSLSDAGYYTLVNKFINEDFDTIYTHVREAFDAAGMPINLSNESLSQIIGLKQLDIDYFNSLALESAQSIRSNLYKYTLSNMSVDGMISQISADLEGTSLKRYSTTYALTSITDFQQGVINVASQDVEDVEEFAGWVYVGVLDGKTRPFCRHILEQNKVLTQEEKVTLESDAQRAYNCRHTFHPISKEQAEEQGYES